MDARCKNGTNAGLPVRLTGVARSHAGHVVTFSDRYRLGVLFRQRGLHPGDGRQRPRHSAERARNSPGCLVRVCLGSESSGRPRGMAGRETRVLHIRDFV